MYSAVFAVAVLGALLGVAKSDFRCFADKAKSLDNNFFKFFEHVTDTTTCQSAKKEIIDSLQQAIDQCSVPVRTDSMSVLIDEICDPRTELYKDLDGSTDCLSSSNMQDAIVYCRPQMDSNLSIEEACLKMKREFFICAANKRGGRCGEKAVRALKRIFQTSDSLTHGMCAEVAGKNSSDGYIFWICIGVGLLIGCLLVFIKMFKKPPPVPPYTPMAV